MTDTPKDNVDGDRRLLQWDIRQDRNAYPEGPLAKDKAVYTFTGWEGCHRGSLLLTQEEAEFFIERLTFASRPADICPTCNGSGKEGRHSICRDCDEPPAPRPNLATTGSPFIASLSPDQFRIHEALCDSQFIAGAKAGWNAGCIADPDAATAAFGALMKSRAGHLEGFAEAKAALAAQRALASPQDNAQCCICGKLGLSTIEGDGGKECQLSDGRWVCSIECWDRAVEPAPKNKMTDVEWKAQVDQARVSGFAEGIERAAKIADEHAAHFEKQAETASSDSMHDALLLAADGCELTADAIREVMGGSDRG